MKNVLAFFLVALMLSASCTRENIIQESVPESSGQLICFQSVVSKITTKSAFARQTFANSDTLYIVADHIEGSDRSTYFDETAFYLDGDGEVWRADKYWPIGGELDFLAYYTTGNRSVKGATDTLSAEWGTGAGDNAKKFVMTVSGNYPSTLPEDSCNVAGNQMDFLYAYSNGNVPLGQVPLVFTHANTWVNFTVKAKQDSTIVLNYIEFHNTAYDGVFVLNNGLNETEANWEMLDVKPSVKFPGVENYPLPDSTILLGDGFILPEQPIRNFTLHYSILGDGATEYTYDFNMERGTWYRGKKYTYNINLNGIGEIEVEPSVNDWDSESQEYNEPESITIDNDDDDAYKLDINMTDYNAASPDTVWSETRQVYGFTGNLSVKSSNERVATAEVSPSGEITFTAKASGRAAITVTDSGTKSSKTVTVNVNNGPGSLDIICNGQHITNLADTTLQCPVGDTLVLTVRKVIGGLNAISDDPNIATCEVISSNLNESIVNVYLKKTNGAETQIVLKDGEEPENSAIVNVGSPAPVTLTMSGSGSDASVPSGAGGLTSAGGAL